MGSNDDGLKIRGFAISIHEVMTNSAVVEGDLIVWRGSVAAIFRELGISQGYHTPIMRMLEKSNCLRQVQRGSRNISSVYHLLRSPGTMTEADWPSISSIVKSSRGGLTNPPAGYKLLEQQLRDMAARLPTLNVDKALSEIAQQVDDLARRVTELEKLNQKQ